MIALVVDPSPLTLRMLGNLVRRAGVEEVRSASDLAGAREELSRLADGGLGLLVTEWDLPGGDGLDLAEEVRRNPALASAPILVVSARNSRQDVERALQAGVQGYILKPLDAGLFALRLEALLAPGEESAAA